MKRYRLDPENPRQLTPEEARQLDAAPIDYSDIAPLDDGFFAKARARSDDHYGPEAIEILRRMEPPPQRSSVLIGGEEIDWSEWSRDAERAPTYIPAMTDDADEATDWGRYTSNDDPDAEERLYYLILRLLHQDCGNDPNAFDSWAISAYEAAIIELDTGGFVEIDRGGGRIYAKLTEKGRNFEAWMERHERKKRIAEARQHLATVPGAMSRREAIARLYGVTLAELEGEQT
jgi:hypothetical protein